MADILIELGTEEIPASYLRRASEDFKTSIEGLLDNNRFSYKRVVNFYTPRRLSITVEDVDEVSRSTSKVVLGPPEKVCFKDGEVTDALRGFAARFNLNVEDVKFVDTEKGRYAAVEIEEPGRRVEDVLKENIENVVSSIRFPKTMVWGRGYRFARPVRWLVCMKDGEVIDVELFGLRSSSLTRGHRFSDSPTIRIEKARDYSDTLRKNDIIVDPEERRKVLLDGIREIAQNVGGEVVEDEELVEEGVNIVEYPVPILCRYDPSFLKLPKEVLITALKYHQRAFSIVKDGKVVPEFIVVGGNPYLEPDKVRVWYERMVRSRLKDALFFFEEDLKVPLEKLVEREREVTWIEEIGTLYDKTMRLVKLVDHMGRVLDVDTGILKRAAYLSKADLLTHMVREKEYTSLQGIMGAIYAEIQGERGEVVSAIREQYLPLSSDDDIPSTIYGSILSICDRIDNIVSAFITGAKPTGSEDPHGIRRQGTGVVMILIGREMDYDIAGLVSYAVSLFNRNGEVEKDVTDFMVDRVYHHLISLGFQYDSVRSVTSLYGTNPYDAYRRVEAIERFRRKPEFADMVIGQKRVVNILRGQEVEGEVDTSTLVEKDEINLYREAMKVEPEIVELLKVKDYDRVMEKLLYLRASIDRFFDNVLVMTDEVKLRNNRLALLNYIKGIFFKMADFSHIVLEE